METEEGSAVDSMMNLFERMNAELPLSTRKSLRKIQKLDEEVKKLLDMLQSKKIIYMSNYEKMTPLQKAAAFDLVKTELNKVLDMTEQKISLARQMKGNVEELSDLFASEEEKFAEHITHIEQEAIKKEEEKRRKAEERRKAKELEEEEDEEEKVPKKRGRKKKEDKKKKRKSTETDNKLYCLCKIFKEDTMIMCDGPKCEAEWFHFGCVGLTHQPEGHWYCGSTCEHHAEIYGPRVHSDKSEGEDGGVESDESEKREQRKPIKRKRI